jgi:N-acetylglucosamine-6-sulfatase
VVSQWVPRWNLRVPLIVRGPGVPEGGVPEGRELEHLALNNDLAPTFADLAGVGVPSFVDGRSLKPLLSAEPTPEEEWRRAFLVAAAASKGRGPPPVAGEGSIKPLLTGDPLPEGWRQAARSGAWSHEDWGRPGLEAVRTEEEYLYVEYGTGDRELYDLRKDPYQLDNRYGAAGLELLQRLRGQLEVLRGCSEVDCRAAEDGF